jgi:hypothetical protein
MNAQTAPFAFLVVPLLGYAGLRRRKKAAIA